MTTINFVAPPAYTSTSPTSTRLSSSNQDAASFLDPFSIWAKDQSKDQSEADFVKINNVKQLVSTCFAGKAPKILLTNDQTVNPHVSCIPNKGILWDRETFRKQELPTILFWTVFEQLNVLSCNRFNEIYDLIHSKSLDLEQAVTSIEKIEHENALKTRAMLVAAIAKEVILTTDFPEIFKDFAVHYRFQQIKGHSQRIASRLTKQFRLSEKYAGTWKMKIDVLPLSQKQSLLGLMQLKFKIEDADSRDRALLKLGCNLVLEASNPNSSFFCKEAAEEIFSSEELCLAHSKASEFLRNCS